MKLKELLKEDEDTGFTITARITWDDIEEEDDQEDEDEDDEDDEDAEPPGDPEEMSEDIRVVVKCTTGQLKQAVAMVQKDQDEWAYLLQGYFENDVNGISYDARETVQLEDIKVAEGIDATRIKNQENFGTLEAFLKFLDEEAGHRPVMDIGSMYDGDDEEIRKKIAAKTQKPRYHPDSMMAHFKDILKL